MIKSEPLISVLICNYNYGKYIKESLDSVIAQKYSNIEIVIIDDGSTDNSVAIINEFVKGNPNINVKIDIKKINEGLCHARNNALDAATGEYFLFLDSDDTIPPAYVSDLYGVAVKEHADIVYGDVNHFGDEKGRSNAPKYDPEKLLLENYINISSLVKKSRIKSHRFDVNLNRKTHEDYDFWLGLSLMGLKFTKADDVFLNYRIQKQSRNGNDSMKSRMLAFVDAWSYSIQKYSKEFPIEKDIAFIQLHHQVDQISSEIIRLNSQIQEQLNPELQKREAHSKHQQQVINHQRQALEEYISRISNLENQLKSVLASKDYRVGNKVLSIPRRLKKTLK